MNTFSKVSISCLGIFALLFTSLPINEVAAYSRYSYSLSGSDVFTPSANNQATFNTDPADKPLLRVSNYTQNPNSTNSWYSSINNVHAGDVVSFVLYYHNTSNVSAVDTRAALSFNNIGTTSSGFTASGKLWAQNAAQINRSVNISFAQPIQDVSLSYQSAFWYPNQNSTSAQSLPSGQSGAEITSAQGVSLGTIAPGWNTQGYLVVRFKVNGTPVTTTSFINDAQCVSIDAPNSINAGQTFSATVVMKNTGTKAWTTDSTPHRLGSQNPQDTLRWGISRVNLSVATVDPNANATFTFTATAPTTPGTYPFDWKMVEENTEWFGATCAKTITVNGTANTADFSLSVSPSATQSTTKPAQLIYTVYVNPVNGYGNPVTLSFISNTAGVSGAFAQNQVYPGGYTTLTVTIASNVGDGYYYPVIRGTMGSITHDLTLTLSVYSGNQATLTITPGSQSAGVNGTAQFSAYYDPDGAGYQSSQNVTSQAFWSSYQSTVASPTTTSGQFIGNAAGAATVAASYAGLTATATLNVTGNNSSGLAPVVVTKPATIISRTSALLNGEVNPNGSETDVWFEYGTTTALGNESPAQTYGGATANLAMAYAFFPLTPNTIYYFRAVAVNQYGIRYGEILSFRTLGAAAVTPPPAPAPANTTVVVSAGNGNACVKLIPSADAPQVRAGENFDYFLIFRNECDFTLTNVMVDVALPEEADLVSTNYPFTMTNEHTLTYKLGTLEKNYQGTIVIRNVLDREALRAKDADTALYTATMNYKDAKGAAQSVTAYLNLAVDTNLFGLAALISIFGSLGWWWLWLLVLALIGYFLYRVWKRYKEGGAPIALPSQFQK